MGRTTTTYTYSMIAILSSVAIASVIAPLVAWTRPTLAALLASVVVFAVCLSLPGSLLRLTALPLVLAWFAFILRPDHSPLAALVGSQRRTHEVIHRISRYAREAYLAGRLDALLPALVAELERLEAPDEDWELVRRVQLADLRATPPQVGVGDRTDRLVMWPWRLALDARIVGPRRRFDDWLRRRRLRWNPPPSFDALPSELRYDFFFLRPLARRFGVAVEAASSGGDGRAVSDARELLDLARAAPTPSAAWSGVRDALVSVMAAEIAAVADARRDEDGARRLAARAEVMAAWSRQEAADGAGPHAPGLPPVGPGVG